MGVKKLRSHVRQNFPSPPSLPLPSLNPNLIIDGSGFLFHLYDQIPHQTTLLNGSTAAFHTALENAITQLQSYGFTNIKVYADGPSQMKGCTRATRDARRGEEWEQLRKSCADYEGDGDMNLADAPSLPLPELYFAQFYHTLASLSIPVVHCPAEADQQIALDSVATSAIVLASDSDFYVLPTAGYVQFADLGAATATQSLPVVTPAFLEEHLHLERDQVIDFAILLGTDFTAHHDPVTMYTTVPTLTPAILANPHLLLSWLQTTTITDLLSDIHRVQDELDFTHDFYDLASLSDYPSDDAVPRFEPFETEWRKLTPLPIVTSSLTIKNIVDHLKHTDNGYRLFTELHLRAFEEHLSAAATKPPLAPHEFEDCKAAHRFSSYLKQFKDLDPSSFFDGPRFHSFLVLNRESSPPIDTPAYPASAPAYPSPFAPPTTTPRPPPPPPPPTTLPIDEHEASILSHIAANRVTIIQGETGCGKSSRIPLFLLADSPATKAMVSQPRRIAAQSLCNRVRSQLPSALPPTTVGLRMGHGVRDDDPRTRVWFVTTGYLVRLLANNPNAFSDHTHLIIDEVHERSVDTDVLLLFARRLLATNPAIKLILMSATLSTAMFKTYFDVTVPHIFVGARRFPVKEYYIDDLKGKGADKAVNSIVKKNKGGGGDPVPPIKDQVTVAVKLVKAVGAPNPPLGTGAFLIFVSGIAEIEALVEEFAEVNAEGGTQYLTLPVHSDIPFEDQMAIFEPPGVDEIKVVIATNAAESSVTIPDCDYVIDLGMAKSIQYNARVHRNELAQRWISRASATQRAGRTGRTRPGTVYRLYSREAFDTMVPFEKGEMHRTTLDNVVLQMRAMLPNEAVDEVLEETIEPPSEEGVVKSLESLCDCGFLRTTDPTAELTAMGSFVSRLGVDLQVGRVVGLAVQLDVLPEALMMAAGLASQSPWRIGNPLVHEPDEYNMIAGKSFLSKSKFDGGIYSDPIAKVRLLMEYGSKEKGFEFAKLHNLNMSKMRQLAKTHKSLRENVEKELHRDAGDAVDPSQDPSRLNRLRLILAWTMMDNLMELKHGIDSTKKGAHSVASIALRSEQDLPVSQGKTLLPKSVEFEFESRSRTIFTAKLAHASASVTDSSFDLGECGDYKLVWVVWDGCVTMFSVDGAVSAADFRKISKTSESESFMGEGGVEVFTVQATSKELKNAKTQMFTQLLDKLPCVYVTVSGTDVQVMTSMQLGKSGVLKILGKDAASVSKPLVVSRSQVFKFPQEQVPEVGAESAGMFTDAPLGARLLSSLALGYKARSLKLWCDDGKKESIQKRTATSAETFKLTGMLGGQFTCVGARNARVIVERGSLAQVVTPVGRAGSRESWRLFGVAGNMLDLAGGGMVVAEGVTLFPGGEQWISMALRSFGYDVGLGDGDEIGEEVENECDLIAQEADKAGEDLVVQTKVVDMINVLFKEFGGMGEGGTEGGASPKKKEKKPTPKKGKSPMTKKEKKEKKELESGFAGLSVNGGSGSGSATPSPSAKNKNKNRTKSSAKKPPPPRALSKEEKSTLTEMMPQRPMEEDEWKAGEVERGDFVTRLIEAGVHIPEITAHLADVANSLLLTHPNPPAKSKSKGEDAKKKAAMPTAVDADADADISLELVGLVATALAASLGRSRWCANPIVEPLKGFFEQHPGAFEILCGYYEGSKGVIKKLAADNENQLRFVANLTGGGIQAAGGQEAEVEGSEVVAKISKRKMKNITAATVSSTAIVNGQQMSFWENVFVCAVCKVPSNGEKGFLLHCQGKKHLSKANTTSLLDVNGGGITPTLSASCLAKLKKISLENEKKEQKKKERSDEFEKNMRGEGDGDDNALTADLLPTLSIGARNKVTKIATALAAALGEDQWSASAREDPLKSFLAQHNGATATLRDLFGKVMANKKKKGNFMKQFAAHQKNLLRYIPNDHGGAMIAAAAGTSRDDTSVAGLAAAFQSQKLSSEKAEYDDYMCGEDETLTEEEEQEEDFELKLAEDAMEKNLDAKAHYDEEDVDFVLSDSDEDEYMYTCNE